MIIVSELEYINIDEISRGAQGLTKNQVMGGRKGRREWRQKNGVAVSRPLACAFTDKIPKKQRTRTVMLKLFPTIQTMTLKEELKKRENTDMIIESKSSGIGQDSSLCCSSPLSLYDIPGPIPDLNHLITDYNVLLNFFHNIPEFPY